MSSDKIGNFSNEYEKPGGKQVIHLKDWVEKMDNKTKYILGSEKVFWFSLIRIRAVDKRLGEKKL